MMHDAGEKHQPRAEDLETVARWAESARRALDEALEAAGVDEETLRMLLAEGAAPIDVADGPRPGVRV